VRVILTSDWLFAPQLPVLASLALSLTEVTSLLALAATCTSLFPLAHNQKLWVGAFRRDFPELALSLLTAQSSVTGGERMSNRQVHRAVAMGEMGGVPPGVAWLADKLLRANWGSEYIKYGGWGSAHLQVAQQQPTL
jgi:hypothetical protein